MVANLHPERMSGNTLLLFAPKKNEIEELVEELRREDFRVNHISKISEMIRLMDKEQPDAFVMYYSENEIFCLEFCHAIKSNSESKSKPIIFVSNHYEESAEVNAFNAGADDFVTNPLHLTAFIQRLKARMDAPKNVLTLKTENGKLPEIRIDREYFAVFVNNKSLDLSKKEFELLYLLASQPGKNFTRQELFEKIWQEPLDENNRTIDVHIVRLRKKIGSQYIKTFKGIGYRFSVS